MELDKRMSELQEMVNRKYIFEKKVQELNDQYYYLKDKIREIVYKLENMDIDIKELNNKTIIYIWYDIFTTKGKSVSKIEYDYKIYVNLYDYIHSEMIELKNKIEKIEEYQIEYDRLISEKEEILLESEKEKYEKMQKLNVESSKYKNRVRDINEAINAANYLEHSLKYLVELLNKTKDWTNFDIFGRGLFLSLTKTNAFKQTDEKVKKLHYLGNKFTRELKVLNFYMDLPIDISEIIHFVDYYENKLYDDIKDKEGLLNIIQYINKGYEIINHSIDTLTLYKKDYIKQLLKIEKEKQQLIENE